MIFFGDSITELASTKNGFITRMQQALDTMNAGNSYALIGSGIGGNKVYDLYLRLEEDILNQKPDIVFIYMSINDINHKKIKGSGSKVVVCTPTVIGEKKNGVIRRIPI